MTCVSLSVYVYMCVTERDYICMNVNVSVCVCIYVCATGRWNAEKNTEHSDNAKSLNIKGMQRKSHETGKIFSGLGVFQASDIS